MPISRLALYRSDDPYTRIPNTTIRDPRLDLKALGLLAIMLSKPDGWRFTERNLADEAHVSRQQVRTALQTLSDAGYVVRERITHEGRPTLQTRVYDVSREGSDSVPAEGSDSVPTLVRVHDGREVGPCSKTKASKTEQERAARAPDLLFEAVVKATGQDPKRLTPSERGRINKALKDLRAVEATPEQVAAAAARWSSVYPGARLTATAIAANWTTIVPRHVASKPCGWCGQPVDEHDDEWCRIAFGGPA